MWTGGLAEVYVLQQPGDVIREVVPGHGSGGRMPESPSVVAGADSSNIYVHWFCFDGEL